MSLLIAALLGISGFILGYLISTLIESFFHHRVSDAPQKTAKKWQRHPAMLAPLLRANYSHHIVHHRRTYKTSHVVQFSSLAERVALDLELAALGAHGKLIRNADYANRLGGSGALSFIVPFLPLTILAGLFANAMFTLGFVAASSLSPWLNHYVHPYLHMSYEEAIDRASPLMRCFIRSRYFSYVAKYHYLHHKYVACNFNLLIGGDWLREKVRRLVGGKGQEKYSYIRQPSQVDVEDMISIRLITAYKNGD